LIKVTFSSDFPDEALIAVVLPAQAKATKRIVQKITVHIIDKYFNQTISAQLYT
jgi:maltoporin